MPIPIHEFKLAEAKKCIDRLFSDRSVPAEKTSASLQELADDIAMMQAALAAQLSQQE